MDMALEESAINKWRSLRNNAVQRGIEFGLSVADVRGLIVKKQCFYTSKTLKRGENGLSRKEFEQFPLKYRGTDEWREVKTTTKRSFLGEITAITSVTLVASFIVLGIVAQLFYWFPVFITTVVGSVGLVFLARGVRRLQKKLKAHIEDLDAHKAREGT